MKADHTIDSSKTSVPWLVFFELVVAGEVLVKRLHRWRLVAAIGWALALILAVAMVVAGCVPNVFEGR